MQNMDEVHLEGVVIEVAVEEEEEAVVVAVATLLLKVRHRVSFHLGHLRWVCNIRT